MNTDQKIASNKAEWNKRYSNFIGWCCLPAWGPYESGSDDLSIIGDIQGKVFLEIACGSGHSVAYLLKHGARKVYALDFSENQIAYAKNLNKEWLDSGRLEFIHASMEKPLKFSEQIDTVFSVYGIGWTFDPKSVFENVHACLKPGGKFVWSWDHSVFINSKELDGKICVERSYHDEKEYERTGRITGQPVYGINRKVSTWFSFLRDAGFMINRYLEPQPLNTKEDITTISSPEMAKYYSLLKAEKLPGVMIFECFKK